MRSEYRYIGIWLSSLLMLLCSSCGGSDSDSEGGSGGGGDDPVVKGDSKLEIMVYTPDHPVVTRADNGSVEPEREERTIKTLDIWVFASEAMGTLRVGDLVGYLQTQVSATESSFVGTYQMTVSDEFSTLKPRVDIYVAANAASAGLNLNKDTDRSVLDNIKIEHSESGDPFGLTAPQTTVTDEGLPMSGVLKNQPITGSQPLLKVETKVQVVRAVSKVRFIFSRTDTGNDNKLQITGITLDNDEGSSLIPKQEYLFLDGEYTPRSTRIVPTYEPVKELKPLTGADQIPVSTYPAQYAYDPDNEDQVKGQAYERLINDGITAGDLAQVGRFYLRESSQQVQGKIYYKIGDSAEKSQKFSMTDPGDFSRNHTWIVYGYFAGKETLKVSWVNVTDWDESSTMYDIYNW